MKGVFKVFAVCGVFPDDFALSEPCTSLLCVIPNRFPVLIPMHIWHIFWLIIRSTILNIFWFPAEP